MDKLGIPELIVIVLVLGLFIASPYIIYRIVKGCRNQWPEKMWLGWTLGFLTGPWSQVYVEEGSVRWFFGSLGITLVFGMILQIVARMAEPNFGILSLIMGFTNAIILCLRIYRDRGYWFL